MKHILKFTFAIIASSTLLLADTPRQQESAGHHDNPFPSIHAALASLREGTPPTEEMIEKSVAEKEAFYAALSEKYDTRNTTQFSKQDQIDCYLVMMKMALIDFDTHGGWPFRYALRFHIANELESRTANSKDPHLHFCAIFSSLSRHKVDHAIRCFKFIQKHDPFLAETAAEWADAHLNESRTKTAFIDAIK